MWSLSSSSWRCYFNSRSRSSSAALACEEFDEDDKGMQTYMVGYITGILTGSRTLKPILCSVPPSALTRYIFPSTRHLFLRTTPATLEQAAFSIFIHEPRYNRSPLWIYASRKCGIPWPRRWARLNKDTAITARLSGNRVCFSMNSQNFDGWQNTSKSSLRLWTGKS